MLPCRLPVMPLRCLLRVPPCRSPAGLSLGRCTGRPPRWAPQQRGVPDCDLAEQQGVICTHAPGVLQGLLSHQMRTCLALPPNSGKRMASCSRRSRPPISTNSAWCMPLRSSSSGSGAPAGMPCRQPASAEQAFGVCARQPRCSALSADFQPPWCLPSLECVALLCAAWASRPSAALDTARQGSFVQL